ncbi:MAG: 16S rRNA (uracil(1498)-N(3))-methyltransferase [Deltaproteobacteria bacterium]|nr:MAG: 16S rRNA (uracil(1498)-N(3))-methyltransferase [Deltaproteobacteria bacterium]
MRLFRLPREAERDEHLVLSGEEARHMRTVLRMKRGDHFRGFDEAGNVYLLQVTEVTARDVMARVVLKEGRRPEPRVKVTLAVGIPKGDRFDFILQKATELSVWEIVPFISSRVQVRIPGEKVHSRLERWRRIILEAVKQCGNTNVPEIPGLYTFQELISRLPQGGLKVILYEKTLSFTLKEVLAGGGDAERITLLVGPEGGFSEEEVEQAREAGFVPAGLGRNILRVETAAIAALAMVQYHFENL